MKNVITVIIAVVVFAIAAGCCACRKGKNNLPLVGTEWHLVKMMERELNISPEQFVFTFSKDGAFGGVGACNRMMGDYTVTEKGEMTFGGVASTRRMCPDIELETRFTQVLESVSHYEVDGDMLLLLSKGELRAVLQAVSKE